MYGGGSLAYTNRMLFTVENFMNEVTAAMLPAPELIYFYTHMDYQLMEVGQNKPTIVPEMILQIRLRLSRNVSMEDGTNMVATDPSTAGDRGPVVCKRMDGEWNQIQSHGAASETQQPPTWNVLSVTGGSHDAYTPRYHTGYLEHLLSS